ncbi:MAG: YtxH domain-containing protein [Rikenellaceae bacterium]|jgi:gas vesicle protein|nr:YtxH domain-containing protein [Rikenellaceae bacterium]
MMRAKDVMLFLGGAALGAVAGLLLAPESGKKTRRRVQRFYEDERDRLIDTYQQVRDEVGTEAKKIGKKVKREIKAYTK